MIEKKKIRKNEKLYDIFYKRRMLNAFASRLLKSTIQYFQQENQTNVIFLIVILIPVHRK